MLKRIIFANIGAVIFFVVIVVLAAFGYGLNIYKLTQTDFKQPYKEEIVRTIGLFPPIGIVIGYIDLEDN